MFGITHNKQTGAILTTADEMEARLVGEAPLRKVQKVDRDVPARWEP